MKRITVEEVAYALLKLPEILDYKEPIGDLTPMALKKLSSCIDTPFMSIGRKYKYWFIHDRAAAMFYFLIKSHSLENGNKRSAVVITMAFLVKNKKWLLTTPDNLYKLACEVAESDPKEKELVIDALRGAFKTHMRDFTGE